MEKGTTFFAIVAKELKLDTRTMCDVTGYSRKSLYDMFGSKVIKRDGEKYRTMVSNLLKYSSRLYEEETQRAWDEYKKKMEILEKEFKRRNEVIELLKYDKMSDGEELKVLK